MWKEKRASYEGYRHFVCAESESPIIYKFGIAETQSKVSFAACSATTASMSVAVNKYLRQSSTLLYQADSKSSLGCIHSYLIPAVTLPATHTHIHISLPTQLPTQLAWLPLYFIMHHVPVWDMVTDFIYVEQWWLSYLWRREIAVDQCH